MGVLTSLLEEGISVASEAVSEASTEVEALDQGGLQTLSIQLGALGTYVDAAVEAAENNPVGVAAAVVGGLAAIPVAIFVAPEITAAAGAVGTYYALSEGAIGVLGFVSNVVVGDAFTGAAEDVVNGGAALINYLSSNPVGAPAENTGDINVVTPASDTGGSPGTSNTSAPLNFEVTIGPLTVNNPDGTTQTFNTVDNGSAGSTSGGVGTDTQGIPYLSGTQAFEQTGSAQSTSNYNSLQNDNNIGPVDAQTVTQALNGSLSTNTAQVQFPDVSTNPDFATPNGIPDNTTQPTGDITAEDTQGLYDYVGNATPANGNGSPGTNNNGSPGTNNNGYPGSNGGYPGSNGGYPGSNGGYPGSNGGYPGSNGGYPGSNGGYPGSNGGYPGSGGYSGGSGGGSPIVLDVAKLIGQPDKGINITQLGSSNTFFDMAGHGRENLTAWAGAGNGVLFFDPTGQGQLTQKDQIVFTAWDPSATSDMQALEDVFDTNHDGALDAGDADFNDFFVMVTNPDGTETAYSLAQLGITSISLTPDATNVDLPDGSSIDGVSSYTTSGGTTGSAATVTLAFDPDGQAVTTTTTTNPDGSTTIDNVALNADGSVAYSRILNTAITSSTTSGVTTVTTDKTLSDLNAGGVPTTVQTDDTTSSGGTSTEVVTNYIGGVVDASGELSGIGVYVADELNQTTTITTATSGGGTQVTILRNQLGDASDTPLTQQEVDTYDANGALSSIVVSNLNPDGSASLVTTTSMTSSTSGSTRSVTSLVDGIAADSASSTDQIVVNGGTQTETVTDSAGTTTTSLITTVTSTTSNSVTRTTSSDLTDGSTLDLTTVAQTVTSSGGSTTTQTDTSANGTLLDEAVTTNTPQTSGGLVTGVTTSELDGYDHLIEVGSSTTTISNAGATATTTVVDDSADGTQRSRTIRTSTEGSPASSTTVYGNGDGAVTHSDNVTVSGGTTTDTSENLNADGSLVGATVTVTSGGLAKTVSVDATGAGTASAPVFDHITTDVTTTSSGSSIETVTNYGAAESASDEIDRTQTVVSPGAFSAVPTTTTYEAFTSASLANGTWDRITTDQTFVSPDDGSLSETVTVTDGAGNVLETTQKNTSGDREDVTTTTTLGTTNLVKTVDSLTTASDGTVQDQLVHFDKNGDVTGATVTTTSADGLVTTTQKDIQGQSASVYNSSGLAFDRTTTDTTVINSDGSRTETVKTTSQNGTLLSTSTTSASANGLSVTTTENPYATAHYAEQTTNLTTLNADGSSTDTVSAYAYDGSLINQTATTTSADGLSKTVLYDFNGDGVTDQATTNVATINPDGSETDVLTSYGAVIFYDGSDNDGTDTGETGGTDSGETNGLGNVRGVVTTTSGIIVPGAGLETQIVRQSDGWVPTYQVETIMPSANGTVTDTTQYYARSGGPLLLQKTVTTSANGLVTTTGTAVNGDTTNDFWTTDTTTPNADGSTTETVANYNRAGLISETMTTVSGNGLSKTTYVDANGALFGSSPAWNRVTTDVTVLNADGSQTETVTDGSNNGSTVERTVTTTSADQQTVTTDRYLDETGNIATVDQSATVQTQANGSVTDTVVSYDAHHNSLGTEVKTASGNGLEKSTTYENADGQTVDAETDTTTYDPDGDGGTTETFQDTDNELNGVTFTTSRATQTTGNAQAITITLALSGALSSTNAGSFNAVANESTSIDDTGQTTQTTTDTLNGASSPNDTTTIVTAANQQGSTISTALGSASPYIVEQSFVQIDGSQSQVTTYYDPASLSVIESQTAVNTSWDGREVTTTEQADYDGLNQSFDGYTPTFTGPDYNTTTNIFVENADGSTTDILTGTGSFGAPAYSQTVTVATNADSSVSTTTLNYDGNGTLIDQTVAETSPDGLVKDYAYDTNGQETLANLDAAAADILTGAALPTSMLGSDLIESDTTTLNADGSKTEVIQTAYGDSFANLRNLTTTDTSANGLVATTFVDNDGSGIYDEVGTTTNNPDGSKTDVFQYFDPNSGTQQIDSMTVRATLAGTNTYTVSANGLVTTLTTSTGITDTTVDFANSNGSFEFSQNVASGSTAAENGETSGSASHFIDANGIDTWSWNNGAGSSGTITIDVATENQDIAIANEIYQTILGHPMDTAERQYLAQDISNGVLNREELAYQLFSSNEYQDDIGVDELNSHGHFVLNQFGTPVNEFTGWNIFAALENALGRLPTAEEMGEFTQAYTSAQYDYPENDNAPEQLVPATEALIPAFVAIAQYAMDQGATNTIGLVDPNGSLIAPQLPWLNPDNLQNISHAGTYSYSGYLLIDFASSGTVTVNGNTNVIEAESGTLDVNGFGNAIDVEFSAATISASNASIMIDDGSEAIVSGNNDQITQSGPSELTLTSGTGDVVYVTSAAVVPQSPYPDSYSTTDASNASITLAAGVGTASAPDVINGNNDTINEGAGDYLTVSGTADTVTMAANDSLTATGASDVIDVTGAGDAVSLTSGTVNVENGVTAVTVSGLTNSSQTVDLTDMAFNNVSLAYSGNTTSGTLTVTNGIDTTNINLIGDYTLDNFTAASDGNGGTMISDPKNPPPPAGTTAEMITVESSTNDYYIYDLGNNAPLAAYPLTQIAAPWQVVGLGNFSGADTGDMLLRNSSTGSFEIVDVGNNNASGPFQLGNVGLEETVAGFGDFSGNPGETDMLMRDSNNGNFELYDISNNTVTSTTALGNVGLNWTVAGFGDFSGNPGETDMLLRDSNTGAFEYYDFANGQVASAGPAGSVGLQWQVLGVGNFDNSGYSDMIMRDNADNAYDLYFIRNNQIVSSQQIGAIGPEWQVAGFADVNGDGTTDMVLRDSNTGAYEYYDIANGQVTTAGWFGQAGTDWTAVGMTTAAPTAVTGDGAIAYPAPTVIQTDTNSLGSVDLAQLDNNYFLYAQGTNSGPELTYNGSPVVVGEFGGWIPIGAAQTATGYDVAWELPGSNQYTVWSTDSSGNKTSNIVGAAPSYVVVGNDPSLQAIEPVFNQDLNGDGVIGYPTPVVIQTDTNSFGSVALTQLGEYYYFDAPGTTTGPELKEPDGTPVPADVDGGWVAIGAAATATGYEVAWTNPSTNGYLVWDTDSNGTDTVMAVGIVTGNDTALEAAEPSFNQDLNGDGVIGLYAAPNTALQISQALSGASGATTIGSGATLEISASDSAAVTFQASTGMLKLDQPSTFSGTISGFTGNGTLSGSDQIDLPGISFNSVDDAYSAGVLTVSDGDGDSASLNFNGSYTLSSFALASDNNGGTIVYDPPTVASGPSAGAMPPVFAGGPVGTTAPAALPDQAIFGSADVASQPTVAGSSSTNNTPPPSVFATAAQMGLLVNQMASMSNDQPLASSPAPSNAQMLWSAGTAIVSSALSNQHHA